jgi:hypothetical protein
LPDERAAMEKHICIAAVRLDEPEPTVLTKHLHFASLAHRSFFSC